MDIACAIGQSGPTLLFTLTNNSPSDVHIADIDGYPSRLVVATPSGKRYEYSSEVHLPPGETYPGVKPKEQRTWRLDVTKMFVETDRYTEIGTYTLRWEITKWVEDKKTTPFTSKKIVSFASNDLLLVRGKDTPLIDPETGQRVR